MKEKKIRIEKEKANHMRKKSQQMWVLGPIFANVYPSVKWGILQSTNIYLNSTSFPKQPHINSIPLRCAIMTIATQCCITVPNFFIKSEPATTERRNIPGFRRNLRYTLGGKRLFRTSDREELGHAWHLRFNINSFPLIIQLAICDQLLLTSETDLTLCLYPLSC